MVRRFVPFLAITLIILFSSSFIGCAGKEQSTAPTKPAPVIEVRMASEMPVDHFNTKAFDLFASEVEKRTGGSIKIIHYPAEQLVGVDAMPTAVSEGSIEFGIQGTECENIVPESLVFDVPNFTDMAGMLRFMYDKKGGGGFAQEVIKPAFESKNLKFVGLIPYGVGYSIITNKKVEKPEDYKGLKIRTPDKGYAALLEGLGASPVVFPSSNVYEGIQRGTIDGAASGTTTFISRKWYEVADYVQILNVGVIDDWRVTANLDFWNSLTKQQQTAILEAAMVATEWDTVECYKEEESALGILKEKGLEIYSFNIGDPGWLKIRDLGLSRIEKVLEPNLGSKLELYNQMLAAAAKGNMTWQESLKISIEAYK